MGNFAVIVDPDPERRTDYAERVERSIAPVEQLTISGWLTPSSAAVWATSPAAPVRTCVTHDRATLVLGDAIEVGSSMRVTASDLAQRWDPDAVRTPDAYDGYYAAVTCKGGDLLTAGADLLGLFPLYYASTNQIVVVSSSPELIAMHPLFRPRLNPEALVGILLMDSLVGQCPLLDGIRRLLPGHALVWQTGVGAREVEQYSLPLSERQSTLSYRDQIAELDHSLENAMRRHAPPGEPHGIPLSGGRDSRMLAGYLEQQAGKPRALTMGDSGDYEVICAARTARVLGLEHRIATTPASDFARTAILHATWDQLASGFASVHLWGMIEHLRALADSASSGYMMDLFAGGLSIKRPSQPARIAAWDVVFPKVNARGIEAGTLKRLLHLPAGSDLVDAVVDRLKSQFEESCPLEDERIWRFTIAGTSRHRVGGVPWRMSFGSWPVLPILDRRVLEVVATLPADTLAKRRAQDEILRTRFPGLARISMVVRNAEMDRPLIPSITDRVGDRVRAALAQLKLPRRTPANRPDRRYIWRMYDFNGPGWQAIRARAEPNRHRLTALFDPGQLAAYLPAPGEHFPSRSFNDTMGRKLLIGLMLWAERHLA